VRSPLSRRQRKAGAQAPLAVNLDELGPRMKRWTAEHPRSSADDQAIEMNQAILQLDAEAKERGAREEGKWVGFLVDDDGFVIDPNDNYVVRAELREGRTFERLRGDREAGKP
jgi:hypothetical protein